MKNNQKVTHALRVLSILFLFLLSFASCQKEEINQPTSSIYHFKELPNLKPDFVTGDVHNNGRSKYSTKIVLSLDWTMSLPGFHMINPLEPGGGGPSHGTTAIPFGSKTACSTVGDFNGDGIDEYIVGYNTVDGPRLYKVNGPKFFSPYNDSSSSWIYSGSTYWTLAGVAAVDFNGDGKDELITALNSPHGPALYKGDATSIGYAKIHQGPSSLSIVAVAAGNFSGNGNEELVAAYNSANGPSLYKSQGFNGGSLFYQGSTFWRIAALTASDFDNNGRDELITGLNSRLGPAMYKGDATSIGYAKIYQGPVSIGEMTSLTSGKFGSESIMHVGFYSSVNGTIVKDHDGVSFGGWSAGWVSPKYKITSLATGNFKFDWE